MQKAFKSLKALRNQKLYGNEWLFVNNKVFNSSLDIKLIGRLDGDAKLDLLDADKKIVASMNIKTEEQEVYDLSFKQMENLPPGVYTLQYSDNKTIKTVGVTRQGAIAKIEKLSKPVVAGQAVQ